MVNSYISDKLTSISYALRDILVELKKLNTNLEKNSGSTKREDGKSG